MKTTSAKHSNRLEERSRTLFEDSTERLDARTRSRLTQARHAALDELKRSRSTRVRWLWMPAGGLAAVTAVAILISLWPVGDRTSPGPGGLPLEDFDIVADGDSVEMLQDMEFYAWLSGQTAAQAGDQSG